MPRAPRLDGGAAAGPVEARRLRPAPALLAVVLLAVALPSARAQAPASAPAASSAQACPDHVVQPGDALAALARRYGVAGGAEALLSLNADRIADIDSIDVGQRLRLPCPQDASAARQPQAPEDEVRADRPPAAGGAGDGDVAPSSAPVDAASASASAAPARMPAPRPDDLMDGAAVAVPSPAIPSSASDPDAPVRALQTREEVPGANTEADARLTAALAEAAPGRPVAETASPPDPDGAPRSTTAEDPSPDARLTEHDLVYPWVRPDCARLERLPPDLAARCTRYDFSAPLTTARIAWFARADAPALAAERAADLRGLILCRPSGMFDGDLAAAGLAPPRAARIAPATARDCLDAVASGEADVASLEARDARRARAQSPPLPDVTELPALASRVTLHAAAWRGSTAGRAALAALDAGLAALRARQAPEERQDADR